MFQSINHNHKIKNAPVGCIFYFGGSGWIRTTSVVRQQIYSLPRLSNSGARPELLPIFALAKCGLPCPPPPRLRRDTQFSNLATASVKISGAGSGNRTRISSLEGLHTSLCTMPAKFQSPFIIPKKFIYASFYFFIGGKHVTPSAIQQFQPKSPRSVYVSPAQQPSVSGFVPSSHNEKSFFTSIGGKQCSLFSVQQLNPCSPKSVYFSPGQQP